MEDVLSLDFGEFELDTDDTVDTEDADVSVSFTELSEEVIVPKKGVFLGLDISQNSSGICLYVDGEKTTYNASVVYDESNPHAEAFMRKQLKDDLLEVIGDRDLDLVVIEDVFEGNNAEVVRKLYALNTAIDDLILEDKVHCNNFVRIQNGTWKSWLSVVDSAGEYKGFNDKEKVKGYLSMLGVVEEGKGFQDRLDATGMLIGYFLKSSEGVVENERKKKSIRVALKDISCAYEVDPDLVVMTAAYGEEDAKVIYINDKKITKKAIVEYMSSDISAIFVTEKPTKIGLLADTLDLPTFEEDGYFGFWLSEKMKRKYRKRQDRLKES